MSRPSRVLHVLNSPGGGATQCALELIRGLSARQYQPFVVAPGEMGPLAQREFQELGVQCETVPMGWWNRKTRLNWSRRIAWAATQNTHTLGNLRSVYGLLRLIRDWKIDIVHTHTGLNPWGAVAAKMAKVRHVWHIHEPNGMRQPFTYWLSDSMFARTLSQLSDHVIFVSEYAAEVFLKYARRTPMEVVYQGIDVPAFSDPRGGAQLRALLGIARDEIVVGMVAGLSSTWKRHDLFVEMAARLAREAPKARFVLFGDLPEPNKKWLYRSSHEHARAIRDMVTERGISDRFVFGGFHSDTPAVMNAIDILVHPCEVEGFGRVAIEAMAAGRPVIGPDRGGISESVRDRETGLLFPAGDVLALSALCGELLGNSQLRQRLGESGRRLATSRFGIDGHVQRVTEIYDEVLTARR